MEKSSTWKERMLEETKRAVLPEMRKAHEIAALAVPRLFVPGFP
jgi:hypothetical protein